MLSTFSLKSVWMLVAAAGIAVLAVACAAEEAAEPAQPAPAQPAAQPQAAGAVSYPETQAPAAQQMPAQPAPARPAAQPAPAVAPSGGGSGGGAFITSSGTAGQDPTSRTAAYKYEAEKLEPGSFGRPFHIITGTSNENIPQQTYKESPMSAALVKQGAILPLNERLPDWSNVHILPPGDETGEYGGTIRTTQSRNVTQTDTGFAYGLEMSPDGLLLVPSIFRDFQNSDDGREYTFSIRAGARWHDGHPSTIEDYRFGLEDLMLNKELMPGLPAVLRSPVTGNDMKVTFIDDVTFKVNFDDPNFSFMESTAMNIFSGIKGCPRCFLSPSHTQKRYHIKYNNSEIPALLEQHNVPNWTKLFSKIRNVRGWEGQPSEAIPTTFDTNYIYKGDHYIPWLGGFWAKDQKSGADMTLFSRNHYHPAVDPEGNQLPYADALMGVRTESREVGIFRTMNGESDFIRRDMNTAEMPLYLANSEKGDYSVIKSDSPDGADSTYIHNQEYVADSDIGTLLRTKAFRIALSHAWDRQGANESLAAGLGTPQNMVPHRSTPYFPGEEWRTNDTEYDLAKAKSIMADLGYTDADADGYLDRKSDGGPLTMYFQSSSHYAFVEWLQSDWAKLGIKLEINQGSSRKGNTTVPPTEYFEFFSSTEGGTNPWSNAWNRVAPTTKDPQGPAIGQFYATRGQEGMAPTGGDDAYTDAKGNKAPSGTYPADISGNMMKLQELVTDGFVVALLSPKRIELGKELFKINSQEKYKNGGVAFAGLFRALKIKRNNMRNVPRNWSPAGGHPIEWFYFEDGLGNVENPGNRSKKYKSVNFLDPEYWQ